MELNSLDDVLKRQLDDLLSAEQQLVEALPKLAGAATNQELREAFEHHLEETRGHVRRLGDVFGQVGLIPSAEQCEAMAGLISEGEKVISAGGDADAKDVALIAAARRVEHYESLLTAQRGHSQATSALTQPRSYSMSLLMKRVTLTSS
jgi:ferritin-like metal-binding protein YciE